MARARGLGEQTSGEHMAGGRLQCFSEPWLTDLGGRVDGNEGNQINPEDSASSKPLSCKDLAETL